VPYVFYPGQIIFQASGLRTKLTAYSRNCGANSRVISQEMSRLLGKLGWMGLPCSQEYVARVYPELDEHSSYPQSKFKLRVKYHPSIYTQVSSVMYLLGVLDLWSSTRGTRKHLMGYLKIKIKKHFMITIVYFRCTLYIVYNSNYTPTTWGGGRRNYIWGHRNSSRLCM
jgi:hypothetical protein